jgi:hypothetical protein
MAKLKAGSSGFRQTSLFDEPTDEPVASGPRVYTWNWWDPWPAGLSERDRQMRQIGRDLRAIEECDADERPFFEARVAVYKKGLGL